MHHLQPVACLCPRLLVPRQTVCSRLDQTPGCLFRFYKQLYGTLLPWQHAQSGLLSTGIKIDRGLWFSSGLAEMIVGSRQSRESLGCRSIWRRSLIELWWHLQQAARCKRDVYWLRGLFSESVCSPHRSQFEPWWQEVTRDQPEGRHNPTVAQRDIELLFPITSNSLQKFANPPGRDRSPLSVSVVASVINALCTVTPVLSIICIHLHQRNAISLHM